MSDESVYRPRAERLDQLSLTFTKDKEFCEALAMTNPWLVGRLFVYLKWLQNYMNAIQEGLGNLVGLHFQADCQREAEIWTTALTAGIYRDISLIIYLVVRGLVWEAGNAVRRSLENIGVLAHIWNDPSTAIYLSDPDSIGFKNTFINEVDRNKSADLRKKRIQKRFSRCVFGKHSSNLYRLLSKYAIHGGSIGHVSKIELEPTQSSCMLVNRPDPYQKNLTRDIGIMMESCELLCVEVAFIYGTFSKKYGVINAIAGDGANFLLDIIDSDSKSKMAHAIVETLNQMGWSEGRIS